MRKILFCFAILTIFGATAGAESKRIVLESHGGVRPDNANALLAPVYAELEGKGFLWGPKTLGAAIDAGLSHSGEVLDAAAQAKLTQQIDDGYAQFMKGNFEIAAAQLEAAQALL